jgi:hypothetical protein
MGSNYYRTTTWQVAHIGFDGDDFKLGDLNVWKEKWRPVDFPVLSLPHPAYPGQTHEYKVYEIGDLMRPIRFAAGELSNGVWGFYVSGKLN